MSPGDAVIYLADPWLHGAGVIDEVMRNGHLLVLFPGEREELFTAHDLELLDHWIQGLDLFGDLERLLKAAA